MLLNRGNNTVYRGADKGWNSQKCLPNVNAFLSKPQGVFTFDPLRFLPGGCPLQINDVNVLKNDSGFLNFTEPNDFYSFTKSNLCFCFVYVLFLFWGKGQG